MDFRQEFKSQILNEFSNLFKKKGFNCFKHIQELIANFEKRYQDKYEGKASGQSWRVWKGNIFEELIYKLIEFYLSKTNISLAKETDLGVNCTDKMRELREQILIEYKKGKIIPDSDIILYNNKYLKVLAILSCKTTFRDRISMVGYWSLKVKGKPFKYIFITLDEDNNFSTISKRERKARLILEDSDGGFVLNENVKEDNYIKNFSHFQLFLDDLIKENLK